MVKRTYSLITMQSTCYFEVTKYNFFRKRKIINHIHFLIMKSWLKATYTVFLYLTTNTCFPIINRNIDKIKSTRILQFNPYCLFQTKCEGSIHTHVWWEINIYIRTEYINIVCTWHQHFLNPRAPWQGRDDCYNTSKI